jgi:hypothetical protein
MINIGGGSAILLPDVGGLLSELLNSWTPELLNS